MKVDFDNPVDGSDEYFTCSEDLYEKRTNAKWTVISRYTLIQHSLSLWERFKAWVKYTFRREM